ncbi:MAG: cupredoxin domain-containing protein [Acidimicrobiales bacterium]|nr:cupredoxin domain-containing protein [Acidimicrobiales bacterium]HRW38513.1 cupredoxin domain-containing protein [Aquihabitans sp.]
MLRRPALTLASLALVAALTSCGSSGSDASDTSSTGAPSTTAAADAATTTTGGEAATSEASAGTGAITLVDGPAPAERTITLHADGTFEPDELTVAVGEVVTFEAAADAGTHAVTFDGSDSYTITGGLTESFTIDEPGTYTASDLVGDARATITVTG